MPVARRRPTLTAVLSDFPPHLRELLRSDCNWDDDSTAALWTSYFFDRSSAVEQLLIDHYMPSVAMLVVATVKGNAAFPDPLDDYLSDGMLGLLQFIRRTKRYQPRITAWLARKAIVKAVWNETRMRSWAGKSRTERARTIELIRDELIHETGSIPTATQITERLGRKVTNPNLYVSTIGDELRSMNPLSQCEPDDHVVTRADNSPQPIDQVLSDEVVHLAIRGLGKIDRKIFRLMLAGKSAPAIAKQMGLCPTSVHNRLNGVLWEARCRAELAAWLEVEPAEKPVKRNGHFVPMSTVPPARLVG